MWDLLLLQKREWGIIQTGIYFAVPQWRTQKAGRGIVGNAEGLQTLSQGVQSESH